MRSMVTSSREVPWRGVAAFVLDNVVPLLGLVALVVLGLGLLKVHDALSDDIAALKALATADRIDRERAAVATRRLKHVA